MWPMRFDQPSDLPEPYESHRREALANGFYGGISVGMIIGVILGMILI